MFYKFKAIWAVCDKKNTNNRIYTKKCIRKVIDKYTKIFETSIVMGEVDHPVSDKLDHISLGNVSHQITNMWLVDNNAWCELLLFDTPSGRIVKEMEDYKIPLGLSLRGNVLSESTKKNITTIKKFDLITLDIVIRPAVKESVLIRV